MVHYLAGPEAGLSVRDTYYCHHQYSIIINTGSSATVLTDAVIYADPSVGIIGYNDDERGVDKEIKDTQIRDVDKVKIVSL